MDVNEILLRIFRGHWRLLLAGIIIPLVVVGALAAVQPRTYVSTARLQASTALPGSDTEADAILNRVTGIATSPAVIEQALSQASAPRRDATTMAGEISVTRLGSSAVFDLAVTDPDPGVASRLAQALATDVIGFLNGGGNSSGAKLLNDLADHVQQLLDQRAAVASQLAAQHDPTQAAALSAQLSNLDQQLNSVGGTLQQLQANGAGGSAVLLSAASPAVASPSHLATDLGLGLVIGLVAGLLVATVTETLRPRVADARAFGRELRVPLLGTVALRTRGDHTDARVGPDVMLAVGRATRRIGVRRLVLAGPIDPARLRALAGSLRADSPVAARAVQNGTSEDGVPSAALVHAAAGGTGETALLTAARDRPAGLSADLDVVAAADVPATDPVASCGLVAVVPPGVRYGEMRRAVDLAEACGWPIVGVLGVSAAGRNHQEKHRTEEQS